MARIEIKMLGTFDILVDGAPVLRPMLQSRKICALVQYLVLRRGERIDHKTLTDALWGGERASNPDMALRAILHRFRNMIDAEGLDCLRGCILTSRGYYRWNAELDCDVDVFSLSDLADEARAEADADRRAELYERMVGLYKGHLLPRSASESWVEPVSLRVHTLYRSAMLDLLALYRKRGENERIVEVSRHAIELDPYEERLYLEEIVALEALGNHTQAQEVTRRGMAMGCLHSTVEPVRASALCRQVRQADRDVENELAKLCVSLSDDGVKGAVLCDYDGFRTLYGLQRGIQARQGVTLFLALLTIVPGGDADEAETEDMMQALGKIAQSSLRRCDVVARYSDTQYVVLQSGSAAESSNTPLERIKAAFYRTPARGRYLLTYTQCAPEADAAVRANRRRTAASR